MAATTLAYLFLLGMTAIDIITPNLIKNVIDCGARVGQAIGAPRSVCPVGVDGPTLTWHAVVLICVLTLVKAVMQFGQGFLGQYGAHGIAYDIRNEIYEHLQRLSFSWHDRA